MATEIDRPAITQAIRALTHGETDSVALMATVACEIHHAHPYCDWTGFYRVTAPDLLKIGPYQGGHGCLVIPFSRGVCGAAARTGQVQNVPDVDAFPGHIACATSTKSELVLPVWNGQPVTSEHPVAFTVFVVCAPTYPTCHLLRLSQLDNPLR